MNVTFRRLLTRGDLPESGGGLYNPSTWTDADGRFRMMVRRELDYTWRRPSFPTIVDPDTKEHHTLIPTGFRDGARIEDCRAFRWRGATLVSHVAYMCAKGRAAGPVRQYLSVLDGDRLLKGDPWDVPFALQHTEKNWVLFEPDPGVLGMVYSLDPIQIAIREDDGRWVAVRSEPTGLTAAFGKPLRNSTHLIPVDGGHLGFWHFFRNRSDYVTGAYWLDADLHLVASTPILIDGAWVQGDVYKRGVCYVSSAHLDGDALRLFYGEGDAHTGVATLSMADVRRQLQTNDHGQQEARLGLG